MRKKGSRITLEGAALPDAAAVGEMLEQSHAALRGAGYRPPGEHALLRAEQQAQRQEKAEQSFHVLFPPGSEVFVYSGIFSRKSVIIFSTF